MTDRYTTSHLPEDQYEPGSNNTVLSNRIGITDLLIMGEVETNELWSTQDKLFTEISIDHSFTATDICGMHRKWLDKIYAWAGKYRSVNISKGGFGFAQALHIPGLMDEFEMQQLRVYTPCNFTDMDQITHALAEVHVELMLIHPFREGNGRLGRMLATLMALQASLPILDFSGWDGKQQETYFAAVRAGMDRDYTPMQELFACIIEDSLQIS